MERRGGEGGNGGGGGCGDDGGCADEVGDDDDEDDDDVDDGVDEDGDSHDCDGDGDGGDPRRQHVPWVDIETRVRTVSLTRHSRRFARRAPVSQIRERFYRMIGAIEAGSKDSVENFKRFSLEAAKVREDEKPGQE